MVSKPKRKSKLTKDEKIFIAENRHTKSVDFIAKKLDRSETPINNYISKLNGGKIVKAYDPEEEKETSTEGRNKKLSHHKGTATVLTSEGASQPLYRKKYESEFKTSK